MTTTKSYLAGLGMTGIVIGSVLVLLAVGTGLVAFDGARDVEGGPAPLERLVVGNGGNLAGGEHARKRPGAPPAAVLPAPLPVAPSPVVSQVRPQIPHAGKARRGSAKRRGGGFGGAQARTRGRLGGGARVRDASEDGGGVAAGIPPGRAKRGAGAPPAHAKPGAGAPPARAKRGGDARPGSARSRPHGKAAPRGHPGVRHGRALGITRGKARLGKASVGKASVGKARAGKPQAGNSAGGGAASAP